MPPRITPGNPQWVEWLEDLAQKKQEEGAKSYYTFKKAVGSLKACPVPMEHPSEALKLAFVGDGIVKYLVKKMGEAGYALGQAVEVPPKKPSTKKRKADSSLDDEALARAQIAEILSGAPSQPLPPHQPTNADPNPNPNPGTPAKKKRATKSYVPRKGSGAFGILIALYKNCSFDDREVWNTKEEIQRGAEPYSDTSFMVPSTGAGKEVGQGNYTAWSSMKTLTQKELVGVQNTRPKRWALTHEGYQLSASLAASAGVPPHARVPTSSSGGQAPYRSFSGAKGGPGPNSMAKRDGPIFLEDQIDSEEENASAPEDDEDTRQLKRALRASLLMTQPVGDRPLAVPRILPLVRKEPAYGALDARKAARGEYGRVVLEKEAPVTLGVDGPFGYHYLDEDDNRVKSRSDAERGQEDSAPYGPTYRIEYRFCQDLHHMTRSVIRPTTLIRTFPLPGGTTKSGYIKERLAGLECPGFIDMITTSASTAASAVARVGATRKEDSLSSLMAKGSYKPTEKRDKDAMYNAPVGMGRLGSDGDQVPSSSSEAGMPFRSKVATTTASTPNVAPRSVPPPVAKVIPPPIAKVAPSNPSDPKSATAGPSVVTEKCAAPKAFSRTTSTQNPLLASYDAVPNHPTINRHPLDPVRDVDSTNYVFQPFDPVILKAGTFKIYLVVDHREVSEKNHHGARREVFDLLSKAGVRVERRGLPLGDFIWVAKRNGGAENGSDDVVLDAIVERKRLDDLCGSIIDGRYVTQKVRMKESAITDRTYLIESFNKEASLAQYGQQIWTCKSQLQVIDSFYVHETNNIGETLSYLTKRTQVLIDMFEKQDLYAIPDSVIDRPTYLPLQKHLRAHQPTRNYLTSYGAYNSLNDSSATKLRQIWGTQIQRVSGLSAEKAVQFTEQWPTMYQFYKEARAHERVIEEENRQLDREEDMARATGAKVKKTKRRKVEDFVVDTLPATESTRGIKGKLGSKIYQLFTEKPVYTE